jgi:hypothetical protein
MSFARSARTDRRRRVMREAIAADSEVAVESVRVRKRRAREQDESELDEYEVRRDPGYSQAVRRACQQRMVQLIPVRSGSLWFVIGGFGALWASLLVAHYFAHIRSTTISQQWPISYLVHLRSTHGIAHWLGSQLWMLTAVASLMIFQLRKHKLDDYRAKYRLWAILAIAALVSSLDVSSSGLFLLGKSLDPWTIREFGYSGWTVVLATFATLVGILGLRLCSELKVAPFSVVFWLVGLLSWAGSALVGTGLVISPWSQPVTDLVVGGAWLGGILAVFLSAGIYLRHIYIEAQQRFILRNRLISKRRGWKLPQFSLRRKARSQESSQEYVGNDSETFKKPQKQSSRSEPVEEYDPQHTNTDQVTESRRRRFALPSFGFGRRQKNEMQGQTSEQDQPRSQRSHSTEDGDSSLRESKRQSWLRLPRWRSNPQLGEDYSDVSSDRRVRDDGFNEPMKKTGGWFSNRKSTNKDSESNTQSSNATSSRYQSATIATEEGGESVRRNKRKWFKRREGSEPSNDTTKVKKSWLSRKPRTEAKNSEPVEKRRWFGKRATASNEHQNNSNAPATKKKWGFGRKEGTADIQAVRSKPANTETAPQAKRGLFGFMDNLKLKPPQEGANSNTPKPVDASRSSIPSSSSSQRNDQRGVPPQNTPVFEPIYDDDDADDGANRHLSKAERKRLRRQQDGKRAA